MKLLKVLACLANLCAIHVQAGTLIVGLEYNAPSSTSSATEYSLNPLTGVATPIGQIPYSGYYATSSSPTLGQFLAFSPVNLYNVDASTGASFLYACPSSGCAYIGDHAYDTVNGLIYALGTLGSGAPPALFHLVDAGVPFAGIPSSHLTSYQQIGQLGVSGITVMEYINGLGLYGTDGVSGYLINESTGQATLLATLRWMTNASTITGLAYDPGTGRLLATSADYSAPGNAMAGKIFLIDPTGGAVTLLNGAAPNMIGIAAISTPEPQPAWMLISGLALCLVLRSAKAASAGAKGKRNSQDLAAGSESVLREFRRSAKAAAGGA